MDFDDDDLGTLRDEISRLLAAALQSDIDHTKVAAGVASAHEAELDQLLAAAEQSAEDRAIEIDRLRRALESRDIVGQAKGVLIVAMRCSSEDAFAVLVEQSKREDRKLVEIAAEVVDRALSRARPRGATNT
jgi:AmiR/NasT family two-component response regulator